MTSCHLPCTISQKAPAPAESATATTQGRKGTRKRKLGLEVTSEKVEGRGRVHLLLAA